MSKNDLTNIYDYSLMTLHETNSTWMMYIHPHISNLYPAVNMSTSQEWLAHEFEPRVCNFR